MSKLFIISGPSGAGEDSVIEGLKKQFDIEKIITTTTRAMRPGEKNGREYYFISKDEFNDGIKNDLFFEYAQEYNDKFYGVTKKEINRVMALNKISIWKIEYKGVISAKKLLPAVKSIMISAPTEILIKRLKRRGGMTEDKLNDRLEYNREWLKNKHIYDFIVENKEEKLDETIEKVADIIKKEANIK